MQFIDTHTHLYASEFSEDYSQIIEEALAKEVKRFFLPAIDSSYWQDMYRLESLYPNAIYLMIGLHPCYVKPETYKEELDKIEIELSKRKFYAIGEIGIDLYWDKSTLTIQKEVFKQQLLWAKKYNLPINIHCREAFDEIFEVLEQEKELKLKGVFHCFTGTYEQAKQAISYGLKLGIGGVVTFKNGKIDQFLDKIDLKHLVLETDAPYLAPAPYRGKRNESSYIPLIAQKLSEIYNKPLNEIATITTANAVEVFGI